ncbi:aldehyde dehydrogenase family protein [Mesorhizobium sp. ESP-6-4]|uniref:aldehyde dehydrogenase family protein n=1 Tax=Mesorhizobium sp. ESP-6-4 TaxID=2876624 RepID=UPI001CCE7784|nr:aldehyde dehydrogenase family protein [Mesorhizobium sp. ESP-6-4]MBZ9661162.1 aldehyde dehydrogenase family protein [Mesorhizobium sp. ESP-6-4]
MLSGQNFVAGEWRDGADWVEDINPSDVADVVGRFAQARPSDIHDAVAAAQGAQREWAAAGLEARAAVLDAIGRELMARSKELGELLSREEGKTLPEGVGEVYRAGQFFTYFAAEALRNLGSSSDSVRAGVDVLIEREPLGVVAIISPWNFPIATGSWKIAPALAFGNAVTWKPASVTPASAWALTEIISRQAIPKGLFNLVMGSGSTIGRELAANADIQGLSFTGSGAIGSGIAALAAARFVKLQLEMGSKNPFVIMDDADLDRAVDLAVNGAFGGTGQKCTASSRLIVHRPVHDGFVEKLLAKTKALKVGHALEAGVQMGPVVSAEQLSANLDYVTLGISEGAELATGGEALDLAHRGHYMAPAVFLNGRSRMRINQEEMFAPITCVMSADDLDEAIFLANDTPYGLTAGIATRSLARATKFRHASRSGCVMVNLATAGTDYHVPFGGVRASSYGPREQGRAAVEFYTQIKTSYIHAGAPE